LHKLLDTDTELRLALETSFNRNLVEKLAKSNSAKSNTGKSTSTQPGPVNPGTEQA